jgi:heme exporter protein C
MNRSGSTLLIAAAGIAIAAALYGALLWAPTERTMGTIQRIFYFHVPAGMVGIAAFLPILIGSIGFLATRRLAWDRLAEASAEAGLLFTTIVLITGPIWAKPVWGIWWTWDARLTSTLVLWFIYLSYILVRAYVSRPSRRAPLAAVVGILGAVDAPIVYFSIRWWRTQHPSPVIGGGSESGLDPAMRVVLYGALLGYVLLFVALAIVRARLAKGEESLAAIAREIDELRGAPALRGAPVAERSGS